MAIDPRVLQQVNYDASVGGRNLAQNPFQRAQNFLRTKLGLNAPDPSIKPSSVQQTNTDAKTGGRAQRAYDSKKPKVKVHSDVKQAQNVVRNVVGAIGGVTAKGLAITAASVPGEDQTMKWKRLGYPSPEAYQKVVDKANGKTPQSTSQGTQSDSRLGSVDTPTPYPTTADTKPIKKSPPAGDPPAGDPPAGDPPAGDPPRGRITETKTNAMGVVQTGTQMSTLGDFNDMYARVVGKHNMSATAYNPFESVHLHTKGDSRGDMINDGPNSYSEDEAAAFNSGQGIEWSSDQKVDAPYTIPKPADVTSTEGAPQIVKSGAQKVVKGVNGHEFGGEHEAPATMKRDRTSELRRKWMLGDMKDENGNDLSNIQRLRGMRMEQGFDRQGDKFIARGSLDPANKSKPTEISRDQYRQATASDAGAQQVAMDLKDAYTAKIKADNNPERSDTQFEPDTSGLNPQVSEAVGLTQAPYSFNAEGPKDERSSKYAQGHLKITKPFAK